MKYPYNREISLALIDFLQPRAKDVVVRRFGLEDGEPQTLERIGKYHGITRERVRQIVDDSLVVTRTSLGGKKEQKRVAEMFQHFVDTLGDMGHVKREDLLIEALDARDEAAHIVFLLTLGDQFFKQRETEDFYPFWTTKPEMLDNMSDIVAAFLQYFKEKEEPLKVQEMKEVYERRLPKRIPVRITSLTFSSYLELSKHVAKDADERWGLRVWPEVNPRGIRDKAYVVLKRTEQPLHFTQVAQEISQLQDALLPESSKQVLPQTVHNELIKDPRFVLVGRGIYALTEWGYKPGTVKDVLVEILRQNGKAMNKQQIIDRALKQRQVKESTILLNLQDKAYFSRDPNGKYYAM